MFQSVKHKFLSGTFRLRGCLKSPDSRQILSSMCLLQLPESCLEACTTSVNLALAGLFKHPLKSWLFLLECVAGSFARLAMDSDISNLLHPAAHLGIECFQGTDLQKNQTNFRSVPASQHFRSFWGAWRTIAGYEAIHMIRKGQACGGCEGRSAPSLYCWYVWN
jgi:hypothetical protein